VALKLKLTTEEFGTLGDTLKPLYVEKKEGETTYYLLDAEVEDTTALRNSVAATRAEREALQKQLKQYEGIDPVKAKEAFDKIADLDRKKLEEEGQFKQIEQQMKDRHAQELKAIQDEVAARDQRIKQREADIERLVVDREIITGLSHPDVQGSVVVMLPHVKNFVTAKQDEAGNWVPVVHDGKGGPRVIDGQGTPMNIKQLCLELAANPDYAANFKTKAKGGSGTNPGGSGAGGSGSGNTVSSRDSAGLSANLEAIAAGKVVVSE